MSQALTEFCQSRNVSPGLEVSVGFSDDSAEVEAVAAPARGRLWLESIDVVLVADGEFSILDGTGGTELVGPVTGVAGVQYTFGPFGLSDGAAIVVVPPTGIVAGGGVTYRVCT